MNKTKINKKSERMSGAMRAKHAGIIENIGRKETRVIQIEVMQENERCCFTDSCYMDIVFIVPL